MNLMLFQLVAYGAQDLLSSPDFKKYKKINIIKNVKIEIGQCKVCLENHELLPCYFKCNHHVMCIECSITWNTSCVYCRNRDKYFGYEGRYELEKINRKIKEYLKPNAYLKPNVNITAVD